MLKGEKNVFAFSVHTRYSHQVFTLILHTNNSHLTTHSVKVKAEKESSVHSVPPAVHVYLKHPTQRNQEAYDPVIISSWRVVSFLTTLWRVVSRS